MELGVYTFAELPPGGDGTRRMRELVEEAVLAEEVGLDVFGVGEHHRPDFAVSAPAVVLAAIAERTGRIRLDERGQRARVRRPRSASSRQFATLDLLSEGRAEIMAGRGSFTRVVPAVRHSLDDYDELFARKLAVLLIRERARESERIGWDATPASTRARTKQPLPIWVAVGGTPRSVVRTGALGLPMAPAIIGGAPERFAPLVDLYRRSARQAVAPVVRQHASRD